MGRELGLEMFSFGGTLLNTIYSYSLSQEVL